MPSLWSSDVCSSRSEEHTSELQSHDNLVCSLLLEKKDFPGSLTLSGENPSDRKIRILGAVEKHYPHLLDSYKNLFAYDFFFEVSYQRELSEKTNALLKKH